MLDLNNHFLIAMPGMVDEDFFRSVLFVFDHGAGGAAALVINQPSESSIKHMFARMDMPLRREDLQTTPVYNGGPVFTERGFVLHEAQQAYEHGLEGFKPTDAAFWASTLTVQGGLEMTTSRDILEAIAGGMGPAKLFMALGYAAWQPGQLESEIMRNDWLTVPADHRIIFDTPPAQRYEAALALLGIDELMLSPGEGGLQ